MSNLKLAIKLVNHYNSLLNFIKPHCQVQSFAEKKNFSTKLDCDTFKRCIRKGEKKIISQQFKAKINLNINQKIDGFCIVFC